ncbi:ECF transporter S component [Ruminococcus sp.]|uniref:ECF transporter S component n=1 Tax=Ruminococcus sp. TaxID=41978 RepID=UPI002587D4B1|nr:ECF transporter S component [Ruminococcus sp.]MCR5020506.1 ECF transporter S component [Ruminococcus sp.]
MSTKTAGASSSKKMDVKGMTILAMFTALGYLCLFVFRFKVSFLTLEFKDVFITMAGFVFGPLAALGVALAESLLEMVTLSDTGFLGAVMNFGGSAAFAVTASLIYKYNKSFKGAVIGLIAAMFSMTAVMLVMNLFITPIYAHTTIDEVIGMIMPLLLPFNLIKSALNAAICFMLYKPISQALKSIHMLSRRDDGFTVTRNTIIGIVIAGLVIVGSIVLVLTVFGGNFELVKSK